MLLREWEHGQLLPEDLRSSIIKELCARPADPVRKSRDRSHHRLAEGRSMAPKRHALRATSALSLTSLQRLLLSAYRQETNEPGRAKDVAAEDHIRHHSDGTV